MWREIQEQPAVIERLVTSQQAAAESLARAIEQRAITHVVLAARGTSDNAARYAQYLWGAMNGLVVALATPSLFTQYRRPPRLTNSLVLGLSQSGRSPDIIAVLEEARRQGALTAVLTNAPGSPLAAQADFVLDLCAGEERAVAATKTYTAELAALALVCMAQLRDPAMMEALRRVPHAVAEALRSGPSAEETAQSLRQMHSAAVIGRGYNYSTTFELALKLQELTYANTQAYSSADFLHGPLALVEPGFPVIGIAARGPLLADLRSLFDTLLERQANLVCISDDPAATRGARHAMPVPGGTPEWLTPLTLIVPGQLLALHLAAARGVDVDAPRSIQKVTETY
jgi:glucosamine--fructose-6-phosphate aminotransferase (isomerizing)